MKTGYDQFFKSARQSSAGIKNSPPLKVPKAKLESQKKSNEQKMKYQGLDSKALSQILIKKSKKKKFPLGLTVASLFGFMIALFGYNFHEEIEGYIKKIEIGVMGAAFAEPVAPKAEAKKSDKAAEKKEADKAEAAKNPEIAAANESNSLDYLQKLNERKNSLDAREQELARQEEELQKQRVEIDRRLEELKEIRGQVSAVLDDRVKVDDQKVEILVQTYSNMKAPQAAKILESMDEDLAVEILGRMKKKNAADVMNLIKPEKAQAISEKFAGYKRKPATAVPPASSTKSPVSQSEANNNKN